MSQIIKKIKKLKIDSLISIKKKTKTLEKKATVEKKPKISLKNKISKDARKNKNEIKDEIKKLPKTFTIRSPKKNENKNIQNNTNKEDSVKLERSLQNPIIKPRLYSWESKATFNPAAFISNGTVHIVYRAIGEEDISVLGYASSYDGYHIQDRPTHFLYRRFLSYIKTGDPIDYDSGGGWSGGCEDPRITLIGDTVYMLYNAFDGWGSLRVGITSMRLEEFNKKKWNWSKTILISPQGERHKNWVLFPEKINGKFAILHNLHTDDPSRIRVEYLDDLEEEDFKKAHFESPDPNALPNKLISWHSRMRSVGPPPIKTDLGWLILYHATDQKESSRYKLGAMITDINDPTKVLFRSKSPILEPDEHYENNGWKAGVIYSCGAVVKYGRLFVYYGGADKFVCVASIKLSKLLDSFKEERPVKLKSSKLIKLKAVKNN